MKLRYKLLMAAVFLLGLAHSMVHPSYLDVLGGLLNGYLMFYILRNETKKG